MHIYIIYIEYYFNIVYLPINFQPYYNFFPSFYYEHLKKMNFQKVFLLCLKRKKSFVLKESAKIYNII